MSLTLDDPAPYFDHLAAFEANHWWSAALWRIASNWLDRTIRDRSGLMALDVGCGAGGTLARLAGRPEIDRVVGLDPSPEALAHAKRSGSLVLGTAASLPFGVETFDVATCLDVIQHLSAADRPRAGSEIARVLRPGGIALIRSNAGGVDGVGLQELRAAFDGLRVVRATHVNAFGSLIQACRGWLLPSRSRSHPGGGGLPEIRRGWTARVMGGVGRIEAVWAGQFGLPLPWGHSTMLLAVKD